MTNPIQRLSAIFARILFAQAEQVSDEQRMTLISTGRLILSADYSVTNLRAFGTPTSGLEWLPTALGAARDTDHTDLMEQVRQCIGYAPWTPRYCESDWSLPFYRSIALGELVGPNGYVPDDTFCLGVFLLAPHTVYPEHAHGAGELYYVICGNLEWEFDEQGNSFRAGPGEFVLIEPHQRHELRTCDEPLFAIWVWTEDIHADTYVHAPGRWGLGERRIAARISF